MASGETADQMVRMSLQGIEVAANVALKAGGMAAKSLAVTLYAILTDKKKVKGKARLNSMLKSGKELKVFAIRSEDLKTFYEEAKHYGVLYSVLKEKNNTDGIVDIMVRAEDASKIGRIVDKFELATVDTKAIRDSVMAGKQAEVYKDVPVLNDDEHDDLVNSLLNSIKKEKEDIQNPTVARTMKKGATQFEHISKKVAEGNATTEPTRPSVRKELSEIRKKNIYSKRTAKQRQSQSVVKSKRKKSKGKRR
ncbi:PcfB family protein [Thomasclavelia sp.]